MNEALSQHLTLEQYSRISIYWKERYDMIARINTEHNNYGWYCCQNKSFANLDKKLKDKEIEYNEYLSHLGFDLTDKTIDEVLFNFLMHGKESTHE